MIEHTYDKEYGDSLIRRLKKGVEYERFGDMEPDICEAEQVMEEAAGVIRHLLSITNG